MNSYGAFQTIYESTLPNSPSTIAWVGSMQGFILLLIGCLSGPIFDAGFFYWLVVPGAFLTFFGMLMTSFATKFYQILLAQGVCMGIGMGLIYIPCVAVLASYFRRRRALALGVAAAGSGSGRSLLLFQTYSTLADALPRWCYLPCYPPAATAICWNRLGHPSNRSDHSSYIAHHASCR